MNLINLLRYILFLNFMFTFSQITYASSELNKNNFSEDFKNVHFSALKSVDFLDQKIKKNKQEFGDKNTFGFWSNKEFLSGIISFTAGTIGYYTVSSDVLKVAYSLVQTIGTLSIGQSVYYSMSPNLDETYLRVSNSVDHLNSVNSKEHFVYQNNIKNNINNSGENGNIKEVVAAEFIRTYAEEEHAKRISRMVTSSILLAQYMSSALINSPQSGIKNIYFYLSGVNLLILMHSIFFKSDYEKFQDAQFGMKDGSARHDPLNLPLNLQLMINPFIPGAMFVSLSF